MQFEEKGERIKDLQLILQRVAFAATLFDDDGIDIDADLPATPSKAKKQKVNKRSAATQSDAPKRGSRVEAALEKLFDHIVGIDLGMWGFGKLFHILSPTRC